MSNDVKGGSWKHMPAVDVDLWEAHYLIATSVPQTLRLLEQAVLRRDADKHGWAWLGYIATLNQHFESLHFLTPCCTLVMSSLRFEIAIATSLPEVRSNGIGHPDPIGQVLRSRRN